MHQNKKTLRRSFIALCLAVVCVLSLGLETKQATVEKPLSYTPPLYETLYTGLMEHSETIDVSQFGIPISKVGDIYYGFLRSHPELFHVNSGCSYWHNRATQQVTKIKPIYNMTSWEYTDKLATLNDTLESIYYSMNYNWTPMQKAMYLYDYLALYSAYDHSYTYRDAYNILVNHTGVCEGYADGYMALLDFCGIENKYVLSSSMNHAWTHVKLYGSWYNVDPTWADPSPDRLGQVSHNYFLCSDRDLSRDHSYTQAEGYGTCSSTSFDDWFWKDVQTAILPYGEDFYFIQDGVITQWDTSENTLVARKSLSSKWYTSRSHNSYWYRNKLNGGKDTNFSVLWPAGDVFLYNSTYSIKSYDPRTNELKTLYKYSGTDGCICGFSYIDNTLTLQISWNPWELNKTVTINNFYV